MTIDQKTVEKVAHLSRLGLDKASLEKFSKQLSVILDYINKLNEINTGNVEPTSHPGSDITNVFRDDKPKQSLPADEALANAPVRIKDFFGVPKVIE